MAPRNRENDDVENDILKNITGGDPEDDQISNDDDDELDFAEEDEEESEDTRHDLTDDDADDDDDVDDRQEEPRRRVTEPVERKPRTTEDEKNEKFQFAEDKQGNFVDKDGNIIVKAGKSRDIFVKIKKAYLNEQRKVADITQRFTETVTAARELLARYDALKANKTLAEHHGLTEEENKQAVELAALNKVDPKGAIKKILTIAHMNGIDLKDIGITGPVDAKTVAEMMLAKQKEEAAANVKTPEQEAKEEADAFLKRHPQARQYVPMVAEAKNRFPLMTLDEIWFQILLNAKPRQQQQEERREQPREQRKAPVRTIPRNGQRPTGGVVNGKLSLKPVDPSKSIHDIGQDLLHDIAAIESRK